MSVASEHGGNESAGTLADISFGSLGSASFRSPPRLEQKVPSVTPLSIAHSSATATPLRRAPQNGDEPDGDELDTRDEPLTPVATRSKRGQSGVGAAKGGVNLTLREQEKVREILIQNLNVFGYN